MKRCLSKSYIDFIKNTRWTISIDKRMGGKIKDGRMIPDANDVYKNELWQVKLKQGDASIELNADQRLALINLIKEVMNDK